MMQHGSCATFGLPVERKKKKVVKVCWGWKCFILSTHLLSARCQSPASVGQWQMKAQIGSVWGGITVFSFESVWCSTLRWFGHYFMSIIKKTSNKMLNSKSDHRAKKKKKGGICVFWLHGAYMDLGVFVLKGPILYLFSGVHFSFWTARGAASHI